MPHSRISYENTAKSPKIDVLIFLFLLRNFESSNIPPSGQQKKIGTFKLNFVGIDVWIGPVDTYSKPLFNLKKPYLSFCLKEKND